MQQHRVLLASTGQTLIDAGDAFFRFFEAARAGDEFFVHFSIVQFSTIFFQAIFVRSGRALEIAQWWQVGPSPCNPQKRNQMKKAQQKLGLEME
jgi:hypothetical protein